MVREIPSSPFKIPLPPSHHTKEVVATRGVEGMEVTNPEVVSSPGLVVSNQEVTGVQKTPEGGSRTPRRFSLQSNRDNSCSSTSFHRQFSEQGGETSSTVGVCVGNSSELHRPLESDDNRSSDNGCCHRVDNSLQISATVQNTNMRRIGQTGRGSCSRCCSRRTACTQGCCHCPSQHAGLLQSRLQERGVEYG